MKSFEEFESFLLSIECFTHQSVSKIDSNGDQHYLDQDNFWAYQGEVAQLLLGFDTIKIEQYEKVLNTKDSTVHIFYNKAKGPSFETHTDPVDVLIECVDGIKYIEVEDKKICLYPKESYRIPANTKHRALNYEKALILSHGIHDTETLNSIR